MTTLIRTTPKANVDLYSFMATALQSTATCLTVGYLKYFSKTLIVNCYNWICSRVRGGYLRDPVGLLGENILRSRFLHAITVIIIMTI